MYNQPLFVGLFRLSAHNTCYNGFIPLNNSYLFSKRRQWEKHICKVILVESSLSTSGMINNRTLINAGAIVKENILIVYAFAFIQRYYLCHCYIVCAFFCPKYFAERTSISSQKNISFPCRFTYLIYWNIYRYRI